MTVTNTKARRRAASPRPTRADPDRPIEPWGASRRPGRARIDRVVDVERRVEIDADGGPLAVGEIDLDTGECSFHDGVEAVARVDRAFMLLRSGGWPVGAEVLPISDGRPHPSLVRELSVEMPTPRRRGASTGDPMTIVVCTRDRPEKLMASLPRLVELLGDGRELIVVDNAPRDARTAEVVSRFGDAVRYVVESTPGLSRARNCGLDAATGKYVTFTDDDVLPDPAWLDVIDATFASNDGAVCVSGTVLPASLMTIAERRFQEFGGYQRSFGELRMHLSMNPWPSKIFPFQPRLVGTGANMSFRAEALRAIGGFDTALGAGTPSRGGEDIDIGIRLLLAGHLIVRQPAAVIWHHSHPGDAELEAQLEDYGCGLASAFTKFATNRSTAPMLFRRLPYGLSTLMRSDSIKNESRSASYPASLRNAELRGMRSGPRAYARSVRQARRHDGGR